MHFTMSVMVIKSCLSAHNLRQMVFMPGFSAGQQGLQKCLRQGRIIIAQDLTGPVHP